MDADGSGSPGFFLRQVPLPTSTVGPMETVYVEEMLSKPVY